MESQPLDERIEWQARRVAAAFAIAEYQCTDPSPHAIGYGGVLGIYSFDWYLNTQNLENVVLHFIGINFIVAETQVPKGTRCALARRDLSPDAPWDWYELPGEHVKEMIAHVLYRLGFEEEAVYTYLRIDLTANEKLELRLSMPREFWPEKWLDEQA